MICIEIKDLQGVTTLILFSRVNENSTGTAQFNHKMEKFDFGSKTCRIFEFGVALNSSSQ